MVGTFINEEGEYEGDWKQGIKEGNGSFSKLLLGIFHYENGDKYDGQWSKDKMNGHGVMSYKDGSKYEGDWVNSERSGKGYSYFYLLGTQTYGDKENYTGDWKHNMKEGQGNLM